jgi:hypothetical protein
VSVAPKPAVLWKVPFATFLVILLSGCGPQWSISSVKVNPQPFSGTDPNAVPPIVLVAPQDGGPSRFDVGFEIEIKRDAGFQSPTIEGSNDPIVGWSASHPLESSCFLNSPIN